MATMPRLHYRNTGVASFPVRPAVVIVDMQTKFVKRLRSSVRTQTLSAQVRIIRLCVEMNIPLFVIEYFGYGPTVCVLRREIGEVFQVSLFTKDASIAFSNPRFGLQLWDF